MLLLTLRYAAAIIDVLTVVMHAVQLAIDCYHVSLYSWHNDCTLLCLVCPVVRLAGSQKFARFSIKGVFFYDGFWYTGETQLSWYSQWHHTSLKNCYLWFFKLNFLLTDWVLTLSNLTIVLMCNCFSFYLRSLYRNQLW